MDKQIKGNRWSFVSTLIAAVVLAGVFPGSASAAAVKPTGRAIDVLALGDSYTAGNGADSKSKGDEYYGLEGCYRSDGNYAHRWWTSVSSSGWYENRACGSDTTEGLAAQIHYLSTTQSSQADVVFVSIGGNDARFSTIVRACYTPLTVRIELPGGTVLTECAAMLDWAEQQVGPILTRTEALLRTLATKADGALIMLVGYPNLHWPTTDRVSQLLGRFSDGQRELVTRLNNESDLAGRLVWFDRRPVFEKHEVDGPLADWIHTTSARIYDELWHPTPDGWAATALEIGKVPELVAWTNRTEPNLADRIRGAIIRLGPSSWLVDDQLVRHRIPDGGTFLCLQSRGHPVIDLSEAEYARLDSIGSTIGDDASAWCFSPENAVDSILVGPTNDSWFVFRSPLGVRRQSIPTTAAFACVTDIFPVHRDVTRQELKEIIAIDSPVWCLKPSDVSGRILVDPVTNRSWLMTQADSVSLAGRVVRHHVTDTETFSCLVARGVPVVRTGYSTDDITHGSVEGARAQRCLDPSGYVGKIVRASDVNPSRSYLIGADQRRQAVSEGGTFLCLSLWRKVPVVNLDAELVDSVADGQRANCVVSEAAGKIVTAVEGRHSIYVDPAGTGHNIRSTNAYACLVEAGVQVMTVPTHEWQQAFPYGPDQPGCTKVLRSDSGASYVEDPDGRVEWIPDTQTYVCWADRLPAFRIVNVSQATVDGMGVDGHAARCLSMARYERQILRDSNGRSGIVLSGLWREIPDGHSWTCYRANGYPIGEYSLHPDHITNIAKGARLAYCLNPADYRNVMVRRSDGTVWKTDGNACRYWVGNGWTYNRLREWGVAVAADGLNTEHIVSLPDCGTHPYLFSVQDFRHTLIRQHNGAVFWVDANGCRYYVRDWYTVERLEELGYQFKHWTAADSEVNSLSYCGSHRYMLAKWRVENKVVRGPDGTSWFVRATEWFWIDSGEKWNYLVNRYGFAGTFSWEHIDSIKWDRGRWAGWW